MRLWISASVNYKQRLTSIHRQPYIKISMSKSQKCLQQWRDIDRKSYVKLAKIHLDFLDSVMKYPSLVEGEHLRNAIRRYELYWLPLCKKHGTMTCEDWAAPIDVAWVWYLHMVKRPANYINDCICLIGNAPSHALKGGKALEIALEVTKDLWNEAYNSTNEHFEVDLDAPLNLQSRSYKQRLPHDFQQLSLTQRNFFYQVCLPHYHDNAFLDAASLRYVTHLDLQRRNTSVRLSHPVDVELIMQTHRLNPIFYGHQISVILGKVVDSEDDHLDDSQATFHRRQKSETATKEIWESNGHIYNKPGTAYRGTLPTNTYKNQPSNYGTPLDYEVSITKIELLPTEYYGNYAVLFEVTKGDETIKTKIKIEQGFASKHKNRLSFNDDDGAEYVQLENFTHETASKTKCGKYAALINEDISPGINDNDALVIGDGNHALMTYKTNVAYNTNVDVTLFEVDKSKLTTSKSCIGKCRLDILKFIDFKDDSSSEKRKVCLPLEFSRSCPEVRLTMVLEPIGRGHNVYQVHLDDYGFAKYQHVAKAVPYQNLMVPLSLLTSQDVPTDVMSYPIKDYRGSEAYSCRVIRTTSHLFYAVDIIDKDGNTRATSTLLPSDSLPFKNDLSTPTGNAFFNPNEGQYAMLIRGEKDWGICFGQQLKLSNVGMFFGLKLFLLHDKANCYSYVHKYKNSMYMFTVPSTLRDNSYEAYIYLHLAEGKVVITGNIDQIPEILAFLIAALILRFIFCDKHQDCWTMIDREGMDLLSLFQSSDDVGLVWDGVYEGNETSIATYRAVVSNAEC